RGCRPRRGAAPDPGGRGPQRRDDAARLRLLEHGICDGQLHRRRARADGARSAGAFGRRDHPLRRVHFRRHDGHPRRGRALSRGGCVSGRRASASSRRVVARWHVACAAAACLAALPVGRAQTADAEGRTVVVTALPVLYSMTRELTAGTDVVVRNLPPAGRPMSALESYFTLQAERIKPELEAADAVVTMGKLWRGDPLYVAARGANIHVVDVDATKPWSTTLEGVGLVL